MDKGNKQLINSITGIKIFIKFYKRLHGYSKKLINLIWEGKNYKNLK